MIALREQQPRFTPAEYLAWEVYQPTERGRWELTTYTDGELVEFKAVNLSVSIDQIYEDIIFAPEDLPSN